MVYHSWQFLQYRRPHLDIPGCDVVQQIEQLELWHTYISVAYRCMALSTVSKLSSESTALDLALLSWLFISLLYLVLHSVIRMVQAADVRYTLVNICLELRLDSEFHFTPPPPRPQFLNAKPPNKQKPLHHNYVMCWNVYITLGYHLWCVTNQILFGAGHCVIPKSGDCRWRERMLH